MVILRYYGQKRIKTQDLEKLVRNGRIVYRTRYEKKKKKKLKKG